MTNNLINYIAIIVLAFAITSCKKQVNAVTITEIKEKKECGCDSLWSKQVSKDFVSILETTTKSDYKIWKDYHIGDGTYILNAGKPNDSVNCLGMWRNGKNISYKCSNDIPKMLTPLYSYYLNYEEPYDKNKKLFKTYENAPDFLKWMKNQGIETAVYMPTDFPNFPFKIPANVKVQLAIHEMFHVQVMLRKWYTNSGFWPDWDTQPDRKAVQLCYSETEEINIIFEQEQKALVTVIENLLDNDKINAIKSAKTFIELREKRYANLGDNKIKFSDTGKGDCRIGESFMEIEEGIADYTSWVAMYNIGTVSREELIRRYSAKQKDMFYITGSMLLHASTLMNDGDDKEIILKMVNALSVEEGNLFKLFKEQLKTFTTQ